MTRLRLVSIVVAAYATVLPIPIGGDPASTPISGSVSGRREDAVRVEFTPNARATPALGDRVAFSTRIDDVDVDAGLGEVTAIDGRAVWVRVTRGRPGLGYAALIQATGNVAPVTSGPSPAVVNPRPVAPAFDATLVPRRIKGICELLLPQALKPRVVRREPAWQVVAEGPAAGPNVTITEGMTIVHGRPPGGAWVAAYRHVQAHGGPQTERWERRPIPGRADCWSESYDAGATGAVRVWEVYCYRPYVPKYPIPGSTPSRYVYTILVVAPLAGLPSDFDTTIDRIGASFRVLSR